MYRRFKAALLVKGMAFTVSATSCFVLFLSIAYAAPGLLKPAALQTTETIARTILPADEHGNTNILLLGVGDTEHMAADLTDTIIIASVNANSRSIVLLSIPRDVYVVDTAKTPQGRVNALYIHHRNRLIGAGQPFEEASKEALLAMADELTQRLDVPIHGVVKVDFTGFSTIVDALGGVDIVVPEPLYDPMYPIREGAYGVFSIDAGPQHLDGVTALRYARSRHSTSDFDRAGRQQQIISALIEKVKEQNLLTDLGLTRSILESVQGHAEWTLNSSQLIALAGAMITVPHEHRITMHLNNSVGSDSYEAKPGGFIVSGVGRGIASGAILLPYSLSWKPADWGQLRTLAHLLFTERELFMEKPEIRISADPHVSLQAHRLRNELIRYGFSVPERPARASGTGTGQIVLGGMIEMQDQQVLSTLMALPVAEDDREENVIDITLGPTYRFLQFEKRLQKTEL